MSEIPYVVYEAAKQVAGTALYWRNSLKQLLRTAGVSEVGYERHAHLPKFQIFTQIWMELDRAGTRGRLVQKQIVQELANITTPEKQAPDQAGASRAIVELRRLATEEGLLVSPEQLASQERRRSNEERLTRAEDKRTLLNELQSDFNRLHSSLDRQARGYEFEKFIIRLFSVAGLDAGSAYRTDIDQVDGSVVIDSFTYVIEAKWTTRPIDEASVATLENKVQKRLESTRGLFISMAGFTEAVRRSRVLAKGNNIVLMEGRDLALMASGHVDILDGLRLKIRRASVHGDPFTSLADVI